MRRILITSFALFLAGCASTTDGHKKTSALSGGRVVFSSDHVKPQQLFVQEVDSDGPPQQFTKGFHAARNPKWSPDGRFIAYLTIVDLIDLGHVSRDALVIAAYDNSYRGLTITARDFGAYTLGYPQWSEDGTKIVLMFWDAVGSRGLGLVDFTEPYAFNLAKVSRLLEPPPDGPMQIGEPIFSKDGATIYFAADTPDAPSVLFALPVAAPPVPVPFTDDHGKIIQRFFAPSLSPDGKRIIFNSEMYEIDPEHYQGEEVLEVNLQTHVVRRITDEPGNQYATFAKNGGGEMLLWTNASGRATLFLMDGSERIPLHRDDTFDDSAESGDWFKEP